MRTWTSSMAVGQTPVLVSTGLNGGYVLWSDSDDANGIKYFCYDVEGNVSSICSCTDVMLSDCQPIYYQGKVVWYTTRNSAPLFYVMNESDIRVYDSTGMQQPVPEQQNPEQVRSFVSRMYTVALGRDAEEAGLNDWTNRLLNHEIDGAGIANGFIMSEEFDNKKVSNETYVDILYRTFFDREADEGDRTDWLTKLANGNSRAFVLAGFVNSVEFDNLCNRYGIIRGEMRTNETAIGAGVRQFVERCYNKVLGKDSEEAGLNDWTGRIARGEESPESVAKLFFSEEYANKNTDNETFVETLYQTFMGRDSDLAGKADWVGRLSSGTSREEVLEGFSRSEEFAEILRSFEL